MKTPGPLPRMALLGILNVTPDSFSDGGKYLHPEAAIRRAFRMQREGAAWIDIGAESTRPGSRPVPPKEQLRRLLPVLRGIRAHPGVGISIDTQSAAVASACLAEGAAIINDISGGRRDTRMLKAVARGGGGFIAMHMLGTPRTMQKNPHYAGIIADIGAFFSDRLAACEHAGIDPERVWLDPGIGFGKTCAHNIEILRRLREFRNFKRTIVVGVSRKSFLGSITGEENPARRVAASVAAGLAAVEQGANVLRVHDVKPHAEALRVWAEIGISGLPAHVHKTSRQNHRRHL